MIEVTKYRHQIVGVYGLGKTGASSIYALLNGGAEVIAWDDDEKKRKKWLENLDPSHLIHQPERILLNPSDPRWRKIQKLILTPGIQINDPNPHPIVSFAKSLNCTITSDIELLWETCNNAKYIAITGTNGKSTTTNLVGHILKLANIRSQVGGNIGLAALDLEPLFTDGVYILELSSYQLDLIQSPYFNISVLLNVTEDHIDYHGNLDKYIEAKTRIFKNQNPDNIAIISIDSEINKRLHKNIKQYTKAKIIPISTSQVLQNGISVIDNVIYDSVSENTNTYRFNNNLHLPGKHNNENIAAAYAIAINFIENKNKIIDAINNYVGLSHRIEYVSTKDNIIFINDSKATNADSTEKALMLFDNIYWILGGVAKSDGINKLEKYFNKIKHAFLIGNSESEFANFLDGKLPYTKCQTLTNAFNQAMNQARHENAQVCILLSPACASLDQWNNFEERGNAFKDLVNNILE